MLSIAFSGGLLLDALESKVRLILWNVNDSSDALIGRIPLLMIRAQVALFRLIETFERY